MPATARVVKGTRGSAFFGVVVSEGRYAGGLMSRSRLTAVVLLALSLVAGACSGNDEVTPATTEVAPVPATTTTAVPSPPTTNVPDDPDAPDDSDDGDPSNEDPAETTTTLDPEVESALRGEIESLIAVTEEVRGLEFIADPEVTILSAEDMAARVAEIVQEDLDADEIETQQRFYRLFGLLGPDEDLLDSVLALYTEQVAGFYNGETGELVVQATSDGALSAYDKSVAVHELIHALTDQHFGMFETLDAAIEGDRFDEASAARALAEGDATYFQLVYIQRLPLGERLDVALEALTVDTGALDDSPEFLVADLLFPYETGRIFVERLVDGGGVAAVDRAYTAPPSTTEHVIDPSRYEAGEPARAVDLPQISVAGYEVFDEGVFGQWALQTLFLDALDRGRVTQVGAGWGGDDHLILDNGSDVAFVYEYLGDSGQDTEDLTAAFIELARTEMGAGQGAEFEDGFLFDEGGPYVWVDRSGDALVVIAATDPVVGERLRVQVGNG